MKYIPKILIDLGDKMENEKVKTRMIHKTIRMRFSVAMRMPYPMHPDNEWYKFNTNVPNQKGITHR